MFNSSFPMLSALHTQGNRNLEEDQFLEYRYAVDYHLSLAEAAQRESSQSLWSFGWHYSREPNVVYLRTENIARLVSQGDIAIRETVSALDTALVLINRVMDLQVPQGNVAWGAPKRNERLRKAMQNHRSIDFGSLESILDSIYSSKGMESLRGYRNWVTHRGAPRLLLPDTLLDRIEIPVAVFENPPSPEQMLDENSWRNHRVETHLLEVVSEQVQVVCWPFVPAVQSVFTGTIHAEAEDIEPLPGFFLGKGSSVTIKDARFVNGSLTQHASDFDANNPHDLSTHLSNIAGEDLATYSGPDYVHGVSGTVRFMEQSLSGELDAELVRLLQHQN